MAKLGATTGRVLQQLRVARGKIGRDRGGLALVVVDEHKRPQVARSLLDQPDGRVEHQQADQAFDALHGSPPDQDFDGKGPGADVSVRLVPDQQGSFRRVATGQREGRRLEVVSPQQEALTAASGHVDDGAEATGSGSRFGRRCEFGGRIAGLAISRSRR